MAHDVIVIGGGPGGYAVAFRAAARGLDVGLVEEAKVGGTCLHRGCIPSKAILHVAEVIEEVRRGEQLGIAVTYDGLLGDRLEAFRRSVIDPMHKGLEHLVKQRCTLYEGRGRVLAKGLVEVTDADGQLHVVDGTHVVLATGSVPRSLPGIDVDGDVVQTSDQALWFTAAPSRAVIVGAGAIGMEFASMWAPMGTEVTVVEYLDRVLPLEDADSSKAVTRAFRKKGVELLTSSKVTGVDVAGGRATVTVAPAEGDGDARTIADVDVVLVAVGRGPNTADTGAAELGILDDRGFVKVDAWGQTDKPGIWAVGDVLPTLALAHAAFAEGFVTADRIALHCGKDLGDDAPLTPVDHVNTPRVTYCHPEVASVGLTEAQAREQHGDDAVTTTTYSLKANAKAGMLGGDGHVKLVLAKNPDGTAGETLGVHLVGPMATDLIGEGTMAVAWGALPREVAQLTHAHPSLYESIGEAFLAAAGTPFHGH